MNERDIFIQAIAVDDPVGRAAVVRQACGEDAVLRQRVEALLAAHVQAVSYLESPPAGLAGPSTIDQPAMERLGTQVGPYKLLEQIGEGGFGVVFMAEQQHPVRRKVALKVIKPGMDTRQVIARFEAERQALAVMDHPNIAKVLDAGETASGRPYFVMELVKGEPITEYCNQARVATRERLELFASVCQAVQHAHHKGIIHRDLKPTNVLIAMHDGQPSVKVIDFGIAKATSGALTDKTLFTGFSQMIGTPIYMSPEQAGQSPDIDTRSDIYSLGVLLYELLTGTTPFDKDRFKQAAYDEIRRIIREEEPPKPSTRLSESKDSLASISAQRHTEPAKLTRLVRGDLDWIVMKALEKDRARRYETANGFALDIERYLADEPVQACPPSTAYRFRKFVHRNRAAMLTAMLVSSALVLGTVVSTRQAVRATAARIAAQQDRDAANAARVAEANERDKAEAILGFFENEILGQANPVRQASLDHTPDPNVKLRTILDRAARKIEGAFQDQPLIEGSIRKTLGECYFALEEPAAARLHLERALVLCRQEYGNEHRYTLNVVGELALVSLKEGRFVDAATTLQQLLESSAQSHAPGDPVVITMKNNLAMAYHGQGKNDLAEDLLRQTVDGYREKFGETHSETITAMNNLALIYQDQRRYDLAEQWFLKAIECSRAVQGDGGPLTLVATFNLLTSYLVQEKYDRAELYTDVLLEFAPKVFGDDHPRTLQIRLHVAEVFIARTDDARLEPLLAKMIEHGPHIWGEAHYQTYATINELALLHIRKANYSAAEPLLVKCLDGMGRVMGNEHEFTLTALHSLIHVLEKQDKHAAAEPFHRRLVVARESKHGRDSPQATQTSYQLGHCLIRQRKYDEAEPIVRECLAVFEKSPPSDWMARAQMLLGKCLAGQKKFAEAEPSLLAGYQAFNALDPTPEHRRNIVDIVELLVGFYDDWGKQDKADEWRKTLTQAKTAAQP